MSEFREDALAGCGSLFQEAVMRRIHQIISRAAVLAAAGLVGVSMSARSASAATLVNTGFENFSTGNVDGQQGFVINPSGVITSTANVTTSTPVEGTQALDISRTAGGTLQTAPHTIVAQPAPFNVTVQADVAIPTFTTGAGDGPFFGLNLIGNNGALGIGSLVIDARNGHIADSTGPSGLSDLSVGTNPPFATAPVLTAGNTFHTLKINADFTAGQGGPVTLNYFVDGVQYDSVVDTGPVNSFDFGFLSGFGVSSPGVDAGASLGVFDNFSITTDAAVPEPTGLAAVAVSGILFLARRSRRSPVAGL
jgi:hypothetical protein